MNQSTQEAENEAKKNEMNQNNQEVAENTIEMAQPINPSDQTNDELAQQHFGAEQLCEILGIPLDQVRAVFVEFLVRTREQSRTYYELAVCPDDRAQCTTESRLPDDQWVQLYFGSTEPDNQVVRCDGGFGISPDQTAPFHFRLVDRSPNQKAQIDGEWVLTNYQSGSLVNLLYLIPKQPGTLFNSLLSSPNQGLTPYNGLNIIPVKADIHNNEPAPTDDICDEPAPTDDICDEPEPGETELTVALEASDNLQQTEKSDKAYNWILKCTSAIVIVVAVWLGAPSMKKKFSGF